MEENTVPNNANQTDSQTDAPLDQQTQQMPASQTAAAPQGQPVISTSQVGQQPAGEPQSQQPTGQQPPMGTPPSQPPVGQPQSPVMQPPAGVPNSAPSPVGALVCGILAIAFSGMFPVGVVLGIIAIVLAGKYFKQGGTDTKGKAGKICGIIGIVLSGIALILYLSLGVIAAFILDEYGVSDRYVYEEVVNTANSGSVSNSIDGVSEACQEAIDETNARLDQIKNHDPQMMAQIKEIATNEFNDLFSVLGDDVTLESCGIDIDEYVDLMTRHFDYEFDEAIESTSEGELDYYLTVPDTYEITMTLSDSFENAEVSQGASREVVLKQLGQIIMDAVREAPLTEYSYMDLEFDIVNGEWIMDEEDWIDELEYLFTL